MPGTIEVGWEQWYHRGGVGAVKLTKKLTLVITGVTGSLVPSFSFRRQSFVRGGGAAGQWLE